MGLFDKLFGHKKNKDQQENEKPAEDQELLERKAFEESPAEEKTSAEEASPSSLVDEDVSLASDPVAVEEGIFKEQEFIHPEDSASTEVVSSDDTKGAHTDQIENLDRENQPEKSKNSGQEFAPSEKRDDKPVESLEEKNTSYSIVEDYYQRKAAFEESLQKGDFAQPSQSLSPLATSQEVEEDDQEKYQRSLKKTRHGFAARLNAFFANFRSVDEEFFEELEELLILSDVGVSVATELTEELRQEAKLENAKKIDDLKRLIIEKLVDIYEKDGKFDEVINLQDDLTVMLFVGVNGVGKTTSIGKLAYRYQSEGKKVMMVAADTFRAGAVAQLAEWGRRVDVPVVVGPEKADPASVVFDGVEKAVAQGVDILLIDTAGRLQNKENLMAELEKMGRIIKRVIPDAPHETLLALDASTGQNALSQAKEFSKILPLTGLILTKIDGSAKGGVVLAIRQELDIPVKFIGFGEKIDDIGEFHSQDFMKGLLADII